MMLLADRLAATRDRPTGFDWMRLLLATSIILWHTLAVSYGVAAERPYLVSPLWRPPVVSLLGMFFCLSGFLVAGSLERCRTPISFAGLRIFRIFPALVVEVLLSALILGPFLTNHSLRTYFTDWSFKIYFFNMFGIVHFVLPGLFPTNPVPYIVNGQLWTVPFELKCYEVLLLVSVLGFYRHKKLLLGVLVVAVAYVVYQNGFVSYAPLENSQLVFSGHGLVLCFLLGVGLFRFRDRVNWSPWLGAISGIAATILLALPVQSGLILAPIPLAYFTVYLGLLNPPKVKLLFGGDYSYGLYLYGYPIQQAVASAGEWTHHWYINLGIALPLAAGVAFLSWNWIEKPVLSRKAVLLFIEGRFLSLPFLAKFRLQRTTHWPFGRVG